jgi:DNA-binding response OmpR family regulator
MRVLIVEDYGPIRSAVARGLRESGFAVDVASDGREGLWYAQSNDYDVIILDLMLPEIDGLTVLRKLRAAGGRSCVLILTAKDQVEDRVQGLNAGADDYLVKPFDFSELLARVRTLVRRKYDLQDPVIRVSDLEIDTASRSVRRGERSIELTAREYALLEYLATRAGQVVTRTEIWEHVYDFHADSQSNVVDVYIGYLRRKIESPSLPPLIHTRRGQGYVRVGVHARAGRHGMGLVCHDPPEPRGRLRRFLGR